MVLVLCLVGMVLGSYDLLYAQISVESLLRSYQRPFTCLEVVEAGTPYSYELGQRYPRSVFVVLYYKSQQLPKQIAPNVVALMPAKLPDGAFNILARCEHFDITLFESRLGRLTAATHPTLLESVKRLGDHLFIGSITADMLLERAGAVVTDTVQYRYYMHTPKEGLDIARWNLYKEPRNEQYRYRIISTLHEKKLLKGDKATQWLPGINLTTYIMLGGIYPQNETIIAELKRYKHLQHNDLVVGNFIIQGSRLRPIDFHDAGRWVQSKYSVRAIIKIFRHTLRFQDPMESLRKYQHRLNKTL